MHALLAMSRSLSARAERSRPSWRPRERTNLTAALAVRRIIMRVSFLEVIERPREPVAARSPADLCQADFQPALHHPDEAAQLRTEEAQLLGQAAADLREQ